MTWHADVAAGGRWALHLSQQCEDSKYRKVIKLDKQRAARDQFAVEGDGELVVQLLRQVGKVFEVVLRLRVEADVPASKARPTELGTGTGKM